MILGSESKRFCSYAFYDPEGIVDDYVFVMLKELNRIMDTIVFVSNGPLEAESKRKVEEMGITIWERENLGFDIEGHKYVLFRYGFDELQEFDEVVLTNSTIAGPLYPLSEMFDSMAERDLDFWGITMHHGENYDPWNLIEYGYIPPHVQSFFVAIRQSLVKKPEFLSYWVNLKPIRSYFEAVGFHEVVFTKKFADMGYKWDVYIDSKDLDRVSSYPLSYTPKEVIIEKRCPVFKRKSLFLSFDDVKAFSNGGTGTELLECLEKRGYDLNLLLPNVLRTTPLLQVNVALSTLYVNDETASTYSIPQENGLCMILYVKDMEYACLLKPYAEQLKQIADVYLFTWVEGLMWEGVTSIEVSGEQTEREVYEKALDIQAGYRYAGWVAFDVDYPEQERSLPKQEYFHFCMDSLFATNELVANHLESMEKRPYVSLLAPGLCSNVVFSNIHNGNWQRRFAEVSDVLEKLNCHVPVKPQYPPYAPYAGCYLVKTGDINKEQLLQLYDMEHDNPMRMIHMVLPCLLQRKGKMTAYGLSTETARGNEVLDTATEIELIDRIDNIPFQVRLYYDTGRGMCEEDSVLETRYIKQGQKMRIMFILPHDTKQIRIDPQECYYLIGKKRKMVINGSILEPDFFNGKKINEFDCFLTKDPMYLHGGDFHEGDKIVIDYSMTYCFGEVGSNTYKEAARLVHENYREQVTDYENRLNDMKAQLEAKNAQFEQIEQSKSYQMMRKICGFLDKLSSGGKS